MMAKTLFHKAEGLGLLYLIAGILLVCASACGNVAGNRATAIDDLVADQVADDSPDEVSISPESQPVTIAFAFALPGDRTNEVRYFETLAEQFNLQYPHITVEIETVSRDPLLLYSTADVFSLDLGDYQEFREQDSLLALDSFIEQDETFDRADLYPSAMDSLREEGQTWGIPVGIDPYVMFYNQDLFDQYGVPYPASGWTWDDFLETALALNHPEDNVYAYGHAGFGPTASYPDGWFFINANGGKVLDDWNNPSRVIFDDPLTIEALEWYADLYHVHNVAITSQQAVDLFGSPADFSVYRGIFAGNIGTWIGSFSTRGGKLYGMPPWAFRWGVVALPRRAQPFSYAYCDIYAISAQTQYPEAAWKWLSFLSWQIPLRHAPARISVAQSEAYTGQVGGDNAAIMLAALEQATFPYGRRLNDIQEVLNYFFASIDRIIDEKLSPQEALSWGERESGQ